MNGTERISIINFNSEDHKKPYCSNLTLSDAQAKDTGYFYCNTSSSNIKQRKTAIYIFVKGKSNISYWFISIIFVSIKVHDYFDLNGFSSLLETVKKKTK